MKEPTLIVMAAGMGSRYGGMKQVEPVTEAGEIIMDFSLYDAHMAGFNQAIFVIKEEMEEGFRGYMADRAGRHMDVSYAIQRLTDLPPGRGVPEGREKPWGTGHAVLCCRHLVKGPFAVINADDYYGPAAFEKVHEFLVGEREVGWSDACMAGYLLGNTISDAGHVARGVCDVSKDGYLRHIVERTRIQRVDGEICYTENDGETWFPLPADTPVSMNFWGFQPAMMDALAEGFETFLDTAAAVNPLKAEYLLPTLAGHLIHEGKLTVKVLPSPDRWYGMTYKEDKPMVTDALQALKDKGLYPEKLWK